MNRPKIVPLTQGSLYEENALETKEGYVAIPYLLYFTLSVSIDIRGGLRFPQTAAVYLTISYNPLSRARSEHYSSMMYFKNTCSLCFMDNTPNHK